MKYIKLKYTRLFSFEASYISLFLALLITINACSTVPKLPESPRNLSTQIMKDKQYYYCESCNVPTQLSEQVYKPLEPDAVIPLIEPMVPAITNVQMQTHEPIMKRRIISHNKHKHKKSNSALVKTPKSKVNKKPSSSKTCIQWSK